MDPFPLLDNLYAVLPSYLVGALAVGVAALCGAAIGWDRERLKKPAGLTTMALICVGAAVYTQASLMMGADADDPARIAAQIVTGIGFLGAGAILRDRGAVTGLTTAATIWAVAAVGIVVGTGYVAGGIGLTALILGILTGVKGIEARVLGPCSMGAIDIDFEPDAGRTALALRRILDDYRIADTAYRFSEGEDGTMCLGVRYCHVHKHHRHFTAELAAHPRVTRVTTPVAGVEENE